MSDEIIKVLDALTEKFGLAFDWTSANVVPYLEQLCGKYVNYEIATSIVWMLLGLLLSISAIVCFKIVYSHKDLGVIYYDYEHVPDDDLGRFIIYCCITIVFIISVMMIFAQIFDIVTCFTFPEKIVIEELKSLMKSNT